jgi:diacylglycerol kinase family enzyme
MRVLLLHNASAGSEDHAAEELAASIGRVGHEVLGIAASLPELEEALRHSRPELIALAGGDGTVGRAVCATADFRIPYTILPLGTANNTACTLGIWGEPDELIAGWHSGHLRGFDLVRLTDAQSTVRVSEAVGWGVFPEVIREAKRMSSPDDRAAALERDRNLFRAAIAAAEPRPYELELDGVALSGEYILVQVMNVPYIGPRLRLSPESDPNDGKLEVLLARAEDRSALLQAVETRESDTTSSLACRLAKEVVVRHIDSHYQLDGRLVENEISSRATIALSAEAAAVQYLVPGTPQA